MVLRLGLFALVLFISSVLLGCAAIPLSSKYTAPKERPITLDQYYSKGKSYLGYKEEVLQKNKNKEVTQKTITINTQYGDILVDYYDHKSNDDDLIFVFPLLGGKPIVSQHFAKYFSDRGIDSAILRRNDDFKNPAFFNKIEKMLRENVVRDRIAIDFFEKVYHKKDFAGFGVSRGAINLAMTAGADPRLKYS
ncbi:MAG: hypothetical protein SGJ02_04445, partial [bacterium]|nr:hypothetical protein [bacterium]